MKSFSIPTSSDKYINSLIEYVEDVKPFHSKLVEVSEETIFDDSVKVKFLENLKFTET